MTHLNIICEAYDRCGIVYRVFTSETNEKWQYLILIGDDEEGFEGLSCDQATRYAEHFIEFKDGEVASY